MVGHTISQKLESGDVAAWKTTQKFYCIPLMDLDDVPCYMLMYFAVFHFENISKGVLKAGGFQPSFGQFWATASPRVNHRHPLGGCRSGLGDLNFCGLPWRRDGRSQLPATEGHCRWSSTLSYMAMQQKPSIGVSYVLDLRPLLIAAL